MIRSPCLIFSSTTDICWKTKPLTLAVCPRPPALTVAEDLETILFGSDETALQEAAGLHVALLKARVRGSPR